MSIIPTAFRASPRSSSVPPDGAQFLTPLGSFDLFVLGLVELHQTLDRFREASLALRRDRLLSLLQALVAP